MLVISYCIIVTLFTATSKDLIDHFSLYLTTEMDSDLIVEHMLPQQLLDHQEVHTITSAASSFQKNCLILEKIRLMDTKSLVSFCEILQVIDCQKYIADALLKGKYVANVHTYSDLISNNYNVHTCIIFTALESFGFLSPGTTASQFMDNEDDTTAVVKHQSLLASVTPADNRLSIKSRKRPASPEQPASQKYFKPSSVQVEFLDMKVQLEHILQATSPKKVYEKCQSLMASHEHNIALFSTEYLSYLKECSHISAILQSLSPFFNWSDHSVLHALVQSCNNLEASMLLQHFNSQVDLSLPITEYPVPQPIPSMAPYDTSAQTVLAVKLNVELSKFSLQQVITLRCLIQKNFQITEHSLQLTAAKSNSTILYWMIPKCVSHLISSKIMQDTSLHGSRVEELSIYPGTLFVSANTLKLGSLSFLNQINEMVSKFAYGPCK